MTAAAIDYTFPEGDGSGPDQRSAPRFTSLIRAAKLISEQGEFVCVIRDVSTGGVGLRCFHPVPADPVMALELQSGEIFQIERVRGEGCDASFRFESEVALERLVRDSEHYPRRPMRLNITMPLTLRTLAGPIAAVTHNISQQGCRVSAALPLAIAQSVIVESPHLPGIRAKVRWRRNGEFGLVFDDTFSLRDFAVHAARLQCPALAA